MAAQLYVDAHMYAYGAGGWRRLVGVAAERAVVPVDQVDVVAAEARVEDKGPQHRIRLGSERTVGRPLLHEVVRLLLVGRARKERRLAVLPACAEEEVLAARQ